MAATKGITISNLFTLLISLAAFAGEFKDKKLGVSVNYGAEFFPFASERPKWTRYGGGSGRLLLELKSRGVQFSLGVHDGACTGVKEAPPGAKMPTEKINGEEFTIFGVDNHVGVESHMDSYQIFRNGHCFALERYREVADCKALKTPAELDVCEQLDGAASVAYQKALGIIRSVKFAKPSPGGLL
ncbi:MAG: hypothetical protein ACXVA8_14220 [Bdellovibrionota bacterium]